MAPDFASKGYSAVTGIAQYGARHRTRILINPNLQLTRIVILFLSGLAVITQVCAGTPRAARPGRIPAERFRVQTLTEHPIEGRDVSFRRFPVTAALSQTRVANIVQDGYGFLWLGTQYGLNRYDGYRSKVFKHEPGQPDSLSCVYVHGLFVDHSGVLWVGCDKFLDKFDPITETFAHYPITTDIPGKLSNPIDSIFEDRYGLLWLATANGLFKFAPATGNVTRYVHDSSDPASISGNQVNFAGEDRRGRFWIASNGGLDEFDRRTAKVIWHLPFDEAIAKIHEDKSGSFWMIMSFSPSCPVASLDRESKLVTCYSIDVKPHLVKSPVIISGIIESQRGTIWLSSTRGLFKLDRERKEIVRYHSNPSDAESLESNNIISIFQDQEKNIWTCFQDTEPNVFDEKPPAFETFTYQRNSIASPLVTTIYEDHSGTLWIGSMGGLNRIDRRTGKDILTPGFGVNNEILCLLEDRAKILFGGTFHHQLKRLDPQTGALSSYVSTDPSNPIMRMIFDHDGNLWAATYGGLSRLDRATKKFITYTPEKQYAIPYLDIKEDSKGIIWLGAMQSGLHRFDPQTGHFTVYEHDLDNLRSLSDNRVNSVQFDRSKNMWIGTQNGLDKFDPSTGSFKTYGEQDGLAGNVVSCILEDRRGLLWMGTNKGLSSFDTQSQTFRNFSVADGLPGPDLTGWGACYESPSGEMFFGGFSGAIAFYPSHLVKSSFVPRIVLTDFQLPGNPVRVRSGSRPTPSITYTKAITLSHKQNIFSIEFSALSYFNPTTNRYRYKLEGLQQQWIEVNSEQRTATYSTLPTGDYTFHVQGATSRGAWSEPGAALRIRVLPPWWGTWWFRVITGLVVGSFVWTIYRQRLAQMSARMDLRYQDRLAERTRIARDLHDTLLQSFQGLMLRFQVVNDLLPPGGPKEELEQTLDRADQAIAEGRSALYDLRSSTTSSTDLAKALRALAKELTTQDSPGFNLLVEGTRRDLQPVIRDELYRIAREALRNAFNHAQAHQLEVEIAYADRLFRLRIRDDGEGIPPAILDDGRSGHYGLGGMRERATQIGAKLKIWSRIGAGTEIELTVAASIAYGTPPGSFHTWLLRNKRGQV